MQIRLLPLLVLMLLPLVFGNFTSQQKTPKFIQFNNFSASFEVPAGKTWVIHQIFSNFSAELKTNADGSTSAVPVRIFIKTLNGEIKTDFEGNRFGPQVFQSDNTAATLSYPIVLPEKTTFSLVMLKGDPGKCSLFDGTGYMSYYEMTNDIEP